MQLHALCAAIAFMNMHASSIGFPRPLSLPKQHRLRQGLMLMAGVHDASQFDE